METLTTTIFAKPTINDFCFIEVFTGNNNVYLNNAFFAQNITEFNDKIVEFCQQKGNIQQILYDASIYSQDARNLRDLLPNIEDGVRLYKSKHRFEERVAANIDWINKHIITDPEYNNPDYIRFLDLKNGFEPNLRGQCDIALDLLSDVARYYRRQL